MACSNPYKCRFLCLGKDVSSISTLENVGYKDIVSTSNYFSGVEILKTAHKSMKPLHATLYDINLSDGNDQKFENLINLPCCKEMAFFEKGATAVFEKPLSEKEAKLLWQLALGKRKNINDSCPYHQVKGVGKHSDSCSMDHFTETTLSVFKDNLLNSSYTFGDLNLHCSKPNIAKLISDLCGCSIYGNAFEDMKDNSSNYKLTTSDGKSIRSKGIKMNHNESEEKLKSAYIRNVSVEDIRSYKLDAWNIEKNDLIYYIEAMFSDFSLLSQFNITRNGFLSFLRELRSHYLPNPYHNFIHAFDVTHMLYMFLKEDNMAELLPKSEIYILLLCGLVHDICHPGVNNSFLIESGSRLAMVFNDVSTLENFHCSVGYQFVTKHNLLKSFSVEEKKHLRKVFVNLILMTDLSKHRAVVCNFNQRLKESPNVDFNDKDDRTEVMKMMIKCADLSNPAKPFVISKRWAEKVQEERYLQGDLEKKLNLPLSKNHQRDNSSPLPVVVVEFIDDCVIPLYTICSRLHDGLIIPAIMERIRNNRSEWEKLI